jgi:hypothetical protein
MAVGSAAWAARRLRAAPTSSTLVAPARPRYHIAAASAPRDGTRLRRVEEQDSQEHELDQPQNAGRRQQLGTPEQLGRGAGERSGRRLVTPMGYRVGGVPDGGTSRVREV